MKPIQELITALLQDILKFLSQNKSFLSESDENRKNTVKSLKAHLPENIVKYLADIEEKEFITDITVLIKILNGKIPPDQEKTSIFKSIVNYLTSEFAAILDHGHFERTDNSAFSKATFNILEIYSYEEITSAIYQFIKSFEYSPYVVIQSPRRLEPDLRSKIRQYLQKIYPNSFPIFMVNHDLIGGLRLFLDGKVHDYSWLNKINRLTTFRS